MTLEFSGSLDNLEYILNSKYMFLLTVITANSKKKKKKCPIHSEKTSWNERLEELKAVSGAHEQK